MKIQLKIEHKEIYIDIYMYMYRRKKKNEIEIIDKFIWLQWSFPRSLQAQLFQWCRWRH